MTKESSVGYCLRKRLQNTSETGATKSFPVTTSTIYWPAAIQNTLKPHQEYSCADRITNICRGDKLSPGLEELHFQLKLTPENDATVQIRLLIPMNGYPMIEALQIPHNSESFLELQ